MGQTQVWPRVPELALDGFGYGQVQIGVGEDDQGRRAAQFHRHPLQRRGALFGQLAAHAGRTGEAQFADVGTVGQHLADGRRIPGDDGQRPLRQSRLIGQFGQGDGGERRLAGGLDHGGAARREGRTQFSRQHGGGEVPRRDQGARPDRLAIGQDQMAQRAVLRFADQTLGLAGEPFQKAVGVGDLALGLFERLAVLQRHQGAQSLGVLVDQRRPGPQEGRAFVRIAPGPVGEAFGRRRNGALRFGRAQIGHMADDLAGRRIVNGDARAIRGDGFARDQGVLFQ